MANYQEVKVELTNTQLKKLKSAEKNRTGAILRTNNESFLDEKLSHVLFLTTKQTTEIKNAFDNNMSTNIKFSKAQRSQITQSGGSFGSWLGNLGKKALQNVAVSLAGDSLPWSVSNLASNAINKFERKISGNGAVTAAERFI